jgi:hypothetical protein
VEVTLVHLCGEDHHREITNGVSVNVKRLQPTRGSCAMKSTQINK